MHVLAWGADTSVNERSVRVRQPARSAAPHPPSSNHTRTDASALPTAINAPSVSINATYIHCQPSHVLTDCWRRIGSDESPSHFGTAPRLSPLAWLDLRADIRRASGRVSIGTFPSTGALAVFTALKLCESANTPIGIFGFGNGSSALSCRVEEHGKFEGR